MKIQIVHVKLVDSWLDIINDEWAIGSGICSVFIVIQCNPGCQVVGRQVWELQDSFEIAYWCVRTTDGEHEEKCASASTAWGSRRTLQSHLDVNSNQTPTKGIPSHEFGVASRDLRMLSLVYKTNEIYRPQRQLHEHHEPTKTVGDTPSAIVILPARSSSFFKLNKVISIKPNALDYRMQAQAGVEED